MIAEELSDYFTVHVHACTLAHAVAVSVTDGSIVVSIAHFFQLYAFISWVSASPPENDDDDVRINVENLRLSESSGDTCVLTHACVHACVRACVYVCYRAISDLH